jgi:hypothetical protein
MQVSVIVPKDRRSSAACCSIRSTKALPMNKASSVPSAANATSVLGLLKKRRFRLLVAIVITPLVNDRIHIPFQLFSIGAKTSSAERREAIGTEGLDALEDGDDR